MTDNKKYEAYENAVRQAWADGQVSIDEADMIEALRKSLNITLEEHASIESKIRKEIEHLKSGGAPAKVPSETPAQTKPESEMKAETPVGEPEPESVEEGRAETGAESVSEPEPEETPSKSTLSFSSDELSKDMDFLSKSIGKLGEKYGMEVPAHTSSSSNVELSETPDKDDSIDEPDQKESIIETSMPGSETQVEKSQISSDSGSSILSHLKEQYDLDDVHPDEEDVQESKDIDADKSPGTAGVSSVDIALKPEIPEPEIDEDDLLTPQDFIEAGKTSFRNKKYKEALRYYKNALQLDPENKEVKFRIKKAMTALRSAPAVDETDSKSKKKKLKKKKKEVESESTDDNDLMTESPDSDAESSESETDLEIASKSMQDVPTADPGLCSSCNGSRVCNWCNGSMKCYWCNGSGNCTKCNGTKEIDGNPCSFCRAEGTCGSCDGTGNCTWCKGTGKCSSCGL